MDSVIGLSSVLLRSRMSSRCFNKLDSFKQVPFIPYSGFLGENLVDKTDKMPRYKGWKANLSKDEAVEGVTLYDALEKLARPPVRYPDRDVRIPINGIYKIKGVGDVITGRVEQGTINAGDAVRIAPRGINGLKVFSIEMHHKTWPNAKPGDNVGMNIKGLDKNNMPKVGDVISLEKEKILSLLRVSLRRLLFKSILDNLNLDLLHWLRQNGEVCL